jgi:CheY-like chemotaxis protein
MMEKQRHIGDLLRAADREIKNGNLELAMAHIRRIFELEVKNIYAKAYNERIVSLMEAQGLTRLQAEQKALSITPKDLPSTAETPPAPVPPPTPAAAPAPKSMPAAQRQAAPTQTPAPAPSRPSAPPVPSRVPPASAPAPVQKIQRSAVAAEAYRSLLMEIWKDGAIAPDEQQRIDAMRETFAITTEEHAAFENDVRITSYLNAIKDEWGKGVTDFLPLRKKFNVSDAEQIAIEPKMFQLMQSLQSKGSVLVLDDELPFLSIVRDVLREGGYYCFTAVSGEEGLRQLETMTPDLIICDINFGKPHMSGFAFYEKFRSIDRFLTTPFIFLSALDQDVLVRTGKKLGADDYLFKPIDAELLLATVEGKLRRSRELKRAK